VKAQRGGRKNALATVPPKAVEGPVLAASQVSEPADSDYDRIAQLAYSFWEARGGQGGSPEEDWHRAEQEVLKRRTSGDL
jgi:hypothetical protein